MKHPLSLILVVSLVSLNLQAAETDIVQRVKDIFPGLDTSDPNSLANINGTLFFRAADEISGNEVWKSDGTEAGTVIVNNIAPLGARTQPFSPTSTAPCSFEPLTKLTGMSCGNPMARKRGR